jgi:hypothetical protein
MTDVPLAVAEAPLPTLLSVTDAFNRRIPSQRFLDVLAKVEPAPFAELAQAQPFRLLAFRALMRDFPERDPTTLWLHAYDVEVDIVTVDPTNGSSATPVPPLSATGASGP